MRVIVFVFVFPVLSLHEVIIMAIQAMQARVMRFMEFLSEIQTSGDSIKNLNR